MKKLLIFCLVLFSLVVLAACDSEIESPTSNEGTGEPTPELPDGIYENDEVKVDEQLDSITIENSFVSASFNLDNGSLTSLENKLAHTDYLNGSVGGNWYISSTGK